MTDNADESPTLTVTAVAAEVAPPRAATSDATTRVRISAAGREIELETGAESTTIEALAATAFALWRATGGEPYPPDSRMTFGLVTSERAEDRSASSAMDWPLASPQ
jgi:hypothetical protein